MGDGVEGLFPRNRPLASPKTFRDVLEGRVGMFGPVPSHRLFAYLRTNECWPGRPLPTVYRIVIVSVLEDRLNEITVERNRLLHGAP